MISRRRHVIHGDLPVTSRFVKESDITVLQLVSSIGRVDRCLSKLEVSPSTIQNTAHTYQ